MLVSLHRWLFWGGDDAEILLEYLVPQNLLDSIPCIDAKSAGCYLITGGYASYDLHKFHLRHWIHEMHPNLASKEFITFSAEMTHDFRCCKDCCWSFKHCRRSCHRLQEIIPWLFLTWESIKDEQSIWFTCGQFDANDILVISQSFLRIIRVLVSGMESPHESILYSIFVSDTVSGGAHDSAPPSLDVEWRRQCVWCWLSWYSWPKLRPFALSAKNINPQNKGQAQNVQSLTVRGRYPQWITVDAVMIDSASRVYKHGWPVDKTINWLANGDSNILPNYIQSMLVSNLIWLHPNG